MFLGQCESHEVLIARYRAVKNNKLLAQEGLTHLSTYYNFPDLVFIPNRARGRFNENFYA